MAEYEHDDRDEVLEQARQNLLRWLKTSLSWGGRESFASLGTDDTTVLKAYHIGRRDALVQVLRECDLPDLQSIRAKLKASKDLEALL